MKVVNDQVQRRPWRVCAWVVIALTAFAALPMLGGCARTAPEPAVDRVESPRVVSLSPAISETIVRLGLGDLLVGRTPWCSAVDPSIPIVGDLMEVDAERLIGVSPTVLLVQPPRSGLDEGLRTLAARQGWSLSTWRIDGVDDILRLIDEVPAAVLPPGERRDAAQHEANAIRDEIAAALVPDPAVADAGRMMLLFGIDPPMAFGAGSYLGEVLERLGGTNAVTARGFPQLSLEDIVRIDPDTIVLIGGAARSDQSQTLLARLDVPRDPARILRFDDPAALVPGPSLASVAQQLRTLLDDGVAISDGDGS